MSPEVTVTITSPDGSRERVYRVLPGQEEAAAFAPECLRGVFGIMVAHLTGQPSVGEG